MEQFRPKTDETKFSFVLLENLLFVTVLFQLLYPMSYISLKHILHKFRLYFISERDLLLRCWNQRYFRKCILASIRNHSCSFQPEYQILKQLTTSLTITFIFQWQGSKQNSRPLGICAI